MRQVVPHFVDPVDLDALYGRTQPRPRPHDRPWVVVSMIASADGATAIDGLSGGLGGAGDKAVFATMRRCADIVIAGAGTVRDEAYRPPARTALRIGVVTARGSLDTTTDLFASGAGFVITSETTPALDVPTIRAGHDHVDLAAALAQLDASVVVCEGGPTLNGAMHAAGLIDEMCLTIAPFIVGGQSARVSHGSQPLSRGLELVHVLTDDDGYLYLRYTRAGSTS